MPYIPHHERRGCTGETRDSLETPGQLNHAVTTLVLRYLEEHGGAGYANYNEVVGVLECAKMELYRRHVAFYEDEKIKQHGDL